MLGVRVTLTHLGYNLRDWAWGVFLIPVLPVGGRRARVNEENEKPSKDKDRKIPLVKSEDGVCEVYSNFIDANWSLFDVRLRFGQIVPAPIGSDHPFDAEERAAITIAWPEAKILRDIMIDVVRRFEETNGEIKPLKLIGQTCLLATHH